MGAIKIPRIGMLLNYYFKFEEGVLIMANVMNVSEGYSLFVLTFLYKILVATVLGFRTLSHALLTFC